MPTPYVGREFTFTNPDGTQVRVRGYGNQFAAVFETLDGFTVAKDPQTGFYHYAHVSPDGTRLEPTGPRVGTVEPAALDVPKHARPAPESAREGARAAIRQTGVTPRWAQRRRARKPRTPAPPLDGDDEPGDRGPASGTALATPDGQAVGSYVGLCLLIRFPDVADSIPSTEVAQYCNAAGYAGFGNNGSVRDYFHTVSDGRLDYTSVVTEYVTAKHPRDHYTDPSVEFGTRARQLIREGLKRLKAQGFDFNQLTADDRGVRPGAQRVLRRTVRQRLERGAVAALLGPRRAVRRVEHAHVLRLPDHQHRLGAHAAHVLPRERAHGLRLPGPVRLRLRVQRGRRLLPHVRRRFGHQPRPGECLPEEPGRLDVEDLRSEPRDHGRAWRRAPTTS